MSVLCCPKGIIYNLYFTFQSNSFIFSFDLIFNFCLMMPISRFRSIPNSNNTKKGQKYYENYFSIFLKFCFASVYLFDQTCQKMRFNLAMDSDAYIYTIRAQILMSFRDTFTRSQSSSENLQYDDNAAYHFYTTILLLVLVPLAYSIFKTVLNPFGHIPRLKEIQNKPHFAKKIAKFKKENRMNYLSCWFVLKIVLMVLIVYGLFSCFLVLNETGDAMKGFDPYQILEVDPDTPVQKIRKSYRKLALKYHPDRNPGDPEANAKFIMISKAYECLTDENAKENCLKFGNPEGSASFNVGIALPSFLVHKDNKVVIMGLVFLLVVIVLPIFLIYYFGEVNKYDENGMLQDSHQFIHSSINQQLSIRDCVKTLALCSQFKNLRINKAQSQKLEILFRQADEDMKKVFMKKKFFNYIKKSMVLIDARVSEKKMPPELMDDFRFIMKKIPVLVKASVMLGLERSNEMVARYRPDAFVGGNALRSLIIFGQYFIQGKSLESESFEQLDLTEEEIDKVYKKKKKRSLTSLLVLKTNEEEREYFFSILEPTRTAQIKPILQYIPLIEEISCIVHTAGEKELTALDVLEVIINIKTNRKSNFCTALRYPFLKMQGWYVMVTDGNHVVYMQHFSFDSSTEYQVKFNRGPYHKTGSYSLNVHILSDCYYGLDQERIAKFQIGPARKIETVEEPHHEEEESTSIFDRLMKNVMPQEEEELSDKEEEDEQTKDNNKVEASSSSSKIQLEEKNQ